VDEQIKDARLERFQARQDEISLERNQEFLGKTVGVMVERRGESELQGRSGSNHIVHFNGPDSLQPGDIVMVTVNHAGQRSLKGEFASC
jgi:tRNA-2-methylthio-N6-dimethylallyladenosine synthase